MQSFRVLFFTLLFLSFIHGAVVIWHYQHDHWPDTLYNHPVEIEGTIINLPHLKNHAEQFWFQTKTGLIQLNWYTPFPQLKPGQEWLLTLKVKPDSFQDNAGEFDYGQYLREQGVIASGYVMAKPEAQHIADHPWQTAIESLRFYVYQQVLAATHGLSMQGILVALILGDKTLLNPHQWQVFSASGTSYFMVISGLHIVLFAAMGGLFARYLWALIPRAPLLIPAQRMGLLVGLCFGLLYSLLAGFPVPTQRALWMLWLMGLAKLFLTRIHAMTLLFCAFLIVVMWDPLSLNSVGFWLSFIAVFFLIYTMGCRYRKLKKWEEWLYPQWVMYVCLMPILVYVFHEFSVISLVTNFIAMPFMMLAVIPLALLGGLILFINFWLGHLLFLASNAVMNGLWFVLQWGTNLPHTMILLPEPSLFAVILSLIGCLILFAPRGIPARWLGLLLMLPLFLPQASVKPGTVKIIDLQVTDGSVRIFETAHAVIIEQNIQHLRDAKSAIHSVIEPYLQMRGKDEINLWILNGSKNYHALQSLENAWQSTKIDEIMLPSLPKIYDSAIISCPVSENMEMDQVNFKVSRLDNSCKFM